MKKTILLLALFLFLSGIVFAQSESIKLLAVSEEEDGKYTGSLADLYLAISPGFGRVYIESYPLSKLDTQFSTRLAKDFACDYAKVDCNKYDFFYTIKAGSSIVGGPSAGAATAVLTISLLNKIKIDKNTTITGTINSGGIIGPVGRLKEKIDSAALNNISRVLIPYGAIEDGIDIIEYGKNKSVEVIEVSDIDEAMHYFTGKELKYDENLIVNSKYKEIMKNVASSMCNRSMEILEKTLNYTYRKGMIIPQELLDLEKEASEFYLQGQELFENEKYYSAASRCFGANVRYTEFDFKLRNTEKNSILFIANSIMKYLSELDEAISKKEKKYLSDLETYMIVKERIVDAQKNIEEAIANNSLSALSYAVERANSAFLWSEFLKMKEKRIKIDKEKLKELCVNKATEVTELYNYAILLLPGVLEDLKEDIEETRKEMAENNYELCLFKSSKTKAEIDVVLSGAGFSEEQLDDLVKAKINAAKKAVAKEISNGIFPIVGYSYYEYADSLKNSEKHLSLIYAEYGLELSNLDVYFKKSGFSFPKITINSIDLNIDCKAIIMLILGIVIGSGITLLISRRHRKFKGMIKFK